MFGSLNTCLNTLTSWQVPVVKHPFDDEEDRRSDTQIIVYVLKIRVDIGIFWDRHLLVQPHFYLVQNEYGTCQPEKKDSQLEKDLNTVVWRTFTVVIRTWSLKSSGE